jgi:hypothetical protein
MTKTDNKLEELEKWRQKKEIEDGINSGLSKWVHIVCRTVTSFIITATYFIGGFVYGHYSSFAAAVKAYLSAEHGGQ